jgi:RNA recognition motif-containing protein
MGTKTLFVGNLPFDVSEWDLEREFAPYGAHRVRLISERGFAFVEVDEDRLQEAVDEKHDSELWGRRLTVNEAKPRDG